MHNITDSGYSDSNGKWVLGGKAILFESDRAGYRSHGSWGAEYDAYLMFLDLEAYDRFRMSKEELELAEANKDEKEKKADEKEEKKKENKKKKEEKTGKIEVDKVKPLELDFENCRDRVVRLTVNSSNMGDAIIDSKGEKVYYQAAFEGGYDLWCHDLKEGSTVAAASLPTRTSKTSSSAMAAASRRLTWAARLLPTSTLRLHSTTSLPRSASISSTMYGVR